ncbi:MAG: DUF554 domain-containing protein [Anaerolineales bacterium]|nr:DUF554 domain-containing protein [Anaerolineales bacterium]
MTGTFINIATVLMGGILGLLFGSRLSDRIKQTIIAGLGLFTAAYGIFKFTAANNELIILGSLLLGGLLGEWWKIEDGLQNLGNWLEQRFNGNGGSGSDRFIRGFLTASLVFCVGPMTIMGAIEDGLSGDYTTLATKAILDGFAALAFASSLGIGVLFSILVILVFQGGISLMATQLDAIVTPAMLNELTAVGGLILVGLAVSSLLEIKKIRTGNFLPALFIAPLIVWGLEKLGI